MTTITDPPKESFRLSQLIYDTRYRSLTFQAIAAMLLALSIWYLGNNLVQNLRAAGLNIAFDFLRDTANYDINQRLIEYDSQSSHARAAVVGVLNTLLVAFLACVTATIFGVLAGVMRLSNNWLVAKIMAIYVEIFRNIPVLIWIIIIFTIMTAVLPGPRAFRGDAATASMVLDSVAFTNRGIYVPKPIWTTGGILVVVTFVLSVVGVFAYRRYAANLLYATGKLLPTGWPSLVILIVPTLLVLYVPSNPLWRVVMAAVGVVLFLGALAVAFWAIGQALRAITSAAGDFVAVICVVLAFVAFVFFGGFGFLAFFWSLTGFGELVPLMQFESPALQGFNFKGGIKIGGPLIALWFALSIYTGAFIAENVRAGIQAVSKGQTEAASALGLRPGRVMNLVVLPQALRVIIPPLISNYLNITKNSSLAIAVGYADVTATLGGITLNQTGRAIECVLLLMLFYLTISLLISAFMNVYNSSIKLKER